LRIFIHQKTGSRNCKTFSPFHVDGEVANLLQINWVVARDLLLGSYIRGNWSYITDFGLYQSQERPRSTWWSCFLSSFPQCSVI